MKIFPTILLSALVAAMPATAALATVTTTMPEATDTTSSATVAPEATASDAAQANSPGADVSPLDDPFRTKPTEGIGQPTPGGIDFQPQVTDTGEYAYWMADSILLPLMVIISLFVLGLLLWVMFRYRAAANPTPSKTSHNTF
ncbi:MAG: cytochrome c oxidase subunit II, partial [Sphingomonadales bacterium]|nr:cytochrome c oxidase subunit II [Sphingomonadales bacterium]